MINKEFNTCIQKKMWQPLNLIKILTTAKFERLPTPKQLK